MSKAKLIMVNFQSHTSYIKNWIKSLKRGRRVNVKADSVSWMDISQVSQVGP